MPTKRKQAPAKKKCCLSGISSDLAYSLRILDVRIENLASRSLRLEDRIIALENPPKVTPWYLKRIF